MIIFMELFRTSTALILHFFLQIICLLYVPSYAIDFKLFPKETVHPNGETFIFGMEFSGSDEETLRSYDFVKLALKAKSKTDEMVIIHNFKILKKNGMIMGQIPKNHDLYNLISDIKTVKTETKQIFSLKILMACRLATYFDFQVLKSSKPKTPLANPRLSSFNIYPLSIEVNEKPVYLPGDKIKVRCNIDKCDNLEKYGDEKMFKYDEFLFTHLNDTDISSTTPLINSSAVTISEHNNVIGTTFQLEKEFTMTCEPYQITCALDQAKMKIKMQRITPKVDTGYCLNKKFEMRIRWEDGKHNNSLYNVEDGATFTIICTAFTQKDVKMVSEGDPATVVNRRDIVEPTHQPGEYMLRSTVDYRMDEIRCVFPRKTFRCYLNESSVKIMENHPIKLRPRACEPKIVSFKPIFEVPDGLNIRCDIRKTIGENLSYFGIEDDKVKQSVYYHFNKSDVGRNRNIIQMSTNISFSTCADLQSRNVTCWFKYEGKVYSAEINLADFCAAATSLWWLFWLLLLLLVPLLILTCCLLYCCCRRCREKCQEKLEKMGILRKDKYAESEEERRNREMGEKDESEAEHEGKKKPGKTTSRRLSADEMYRMFKRKRPFGWRELNEHFRWLSMMEAMENPESRTRSLSPTARGYAAFRLMKKRMRFGSRELFSYSQTLAKQNEAKDDDVPTTLVDADSLNMINITPSMSQERLNMPEFDEESGGTIENSAAENPQKPNDNASNIRASNNKQTTSQGQGQQVRTTNNLANENLEFENPKKLDKNTSNRRTSNNNIEIEIEGQNDFEKFGNRHDTTDQKNLEVRVKKDKKAIKQRKTPNADPESDDESNKWNSPNGNSRKRSKSNFELA